MNILDALKDLIEEGKRLLPFGGNYFESYNTEHQSEYVAWRLHVIALLEEMGHAAKSLIRVIESDKNSSYLYQASVQQILGVLQGAVAIAERQSNTLSLTTTKSTTSDFNIIWGPLRSILENKFTFNNIKEIVGLAGIDLPGISHLQQSQGSATSNGQLMTALDGMLGSMQEAKKKQFITIVTEEILHRQPKVYGNLQDYLSRLGWAVYENTIIPLEILDVSELPELPVEARSDLVKASQRLRDGDLSGAISAACGAVDTTTNRIYKEKTLGDPGSTSFQERVTVCLKSYGTLTHIEADLQALGWDAKEIKPFKENLAKAINQAAAVMQTLRVNMGDVHGSKPILKPLVFDSIKWASLIIRLLA